MSIEETPVRDAGPAPAAPANGPLINISYTAPIPPKAEQQPSAEGNTPTDAGSPQHTLFVSRQPEAAATQAVDDMPVFDAGPARVDLMKR